jgi:type II secretory ATPase GspE/PulE/Tfp pilus assembly ATPase PilB-like protein
VGLVDTHEHETEVENLAVHRFDSQSGQSPASILKTLLLAQPDFLAVPNLVNSRSLDLLTSQVVDGKRTVVTRVQANSAAEALLRVYSLSQNKSQFIKAVTGVTGQRLARRLCDQCKQPANVQPKLIQQLGGDPNKPATLFNAWKMPPLEQQVDERGRPIEFKPCEVCSGIGYIGRIAIFEMIAVDDRLRGVLTKQPELAAIQTYVRESGQLSLIEQSYKLVLLGITSLSEIQRVMKK